MIGFVTGVSRDGSSIMCVVFFFQAEDGIRDRLVTGVQTCALPICPRSEHPFNRSRKRLRLVRRDLDGRTTRHRSRRTHAFNPTQPGSKRDQEIGRASWRERV